MQATVIDNTNNVENDLTVKANIFLRTISDVIVAKSRDNTPMKTGGLRNEVLKEVLGLSGKISWAVNYAIFQEQKQFQNYTTPGTGPHFAEDAVNQVVEDTTVIAQQVGLI